MTAMQERQLDLDEYGPVEARRMLIASQEAYQRALEERELALLVCDHARVPHREIGPIIGRHASTAWELIRTLRKKWQEDRLEWSPNQLARLLSLPRPKHEEPGQT